jgi:hypothetical protein
MPKPLTIPRPSKKAPPKKASSRKAAARRAAPRTTTEVEETWAIAAAHHNPVATQNALRDYRRRMKASNGG